MQELEAICIIELVGAPKEHVEEVMNKVVEKIKGSFKVIRYNIFETKQLDKFWSTFTEVTINFEKLEDLFGFCFDYMPSSVEIIKPDKLDINNNNVNELLNDMVGRLHEYDMLMKNLKAANSLLKKEIEEKK